MPQKTTLEILVECFDIIGGLATAIAVFLSWWTIRVMVKQRKQSLQPDIEIENVSHQVYYQMLSNNLNTLEDFKINYWGNTNPDTQVDEIPVVRLVNLGLGVAKHIEIDAFFDFEKIVKEIKRLDEKKEYRIKTMNDDVVIARPFGKYDNVFTGKTQAQFKYIQTQSSEQEKTYLAIPSAYFILTTIYFNLAKKEYKLRDKTFQFPRLEVKIKYRDMDKKPFSKYLKGEIQEPFFIESNISNTGKRIAEFTTIFN